MMKKSKVILTITLFCAATSPVVAQTDFSNNEDSMFAPVNNRNVRTDSLGSDKEIPKGLKVWTIDERFGDRQEAQVDTLQHMYMNTPFTSGLRGEYNSLGNLGSPRINRIFIDRRLDQGQFIFAQPFDCISTPVSEFHFTNTYSPITNVTLNSCGNRTNGEDDFKAMFAVNAGKRLGMGFRFDYKYGRGYYDSQSTSHFKYTMWGSYIGDRYQAHLLFSTLHQKATENGGITNDDYIKHPELFEDTYAENEIPTVLQQNWNRNNSIHVFFNHRYNVGFNRKVRMTDEEIKAKKFAMASKKENAAEDAKEEARKKARQEGKKFDEKKFELACKHANRTAQNWLKVCDFLQYKPAPMSGFDLFNHMADVVTARGKEAAADACELQSKDLQKNIEEGTSTLPFPEQYRVMFEGIPCWPKLPNLFKPLKENGVNVTAVVYAPAFGFVYNNMDEMARAYYKAPNSVCIEQGVAWREGICRDNKVDGVLVHYNRSCKPWSGYMAEMQRRFTADLGVPCAGFDGDQADPRNFNEAQYATRVQGLVEAMEANKKD